MPGEVVSILGRARQEQLHWPRHRQSDEESLLRRVLSFRTHCNANLPKLDTGLAEFASAILDAQALRGRCISPDLVADPAWAMVLTVYVGETRSSGVSVLSLRDSPVIGPSTVTLRWILKLLDDGVFQLIENESQLDLPLVRLSSDARSDVEKWLRLFEVRLRLIGA